MAYVCFKCRRSLGPDLRAFFSHLRVMHDVLSTSTYFQFAQLGCHRSFDNQRSFRRHLQGHAIEFNAGTEQEGSSSQLFDGALSPDLQCGVLGEVECRDFSGGMGRVRGRQHYRQSCTLLS